MKNFENQLDNLHVPLIEDESLQHDLRRNIANKYYSKENHYRILYRRTLAVSFSLLAVIIGLILKPLIIHEVPENIIKPENDKLYEDKFAFLDNADGLKYTSIENPNLINRVNPEDYQECKTYVIREYKSPDKDGILIISEFDQNPANKTKKRLVDHSF